MFLTNSSTRVYTHSVLMTSTLCTAHRFPLTLTFLINSVTFQLHDGKYHKSKFLPVNPTKKSVQAEVQYHPILTSTPGKGEWSASPPSHCNLLPNEMEAGSVPKPIWTRLENKNYFAPDDSAVDQPQPVKGTKKR
jgi:hypothetical protein